MRQVNLVMVAVSSPSDVEEERSAVKAVIEQANRMPEFSQFRLELVSSDHVPPGVGTEPQDVINRVLSHADIFIGIMWGRFGTSTRNFGSGTEEEFQCSLRQFRENPDSVEIMMYFKEAALPYRETDGVQLSSVHNFRKSLSRFGVFYRAFESTEDFGRDLLIHLSLKIDEIRKKREATQSVPIDATLADQEHVALVADVQVTFETEELGLLEYLDTTEQSFSSLKEIIENISGDTTRVTEQIKQRTREIQAATATSGGPLDRQDARVLINRAAANLTNYSERVRPMIPILADQFDTGLEAVSHAIAIAIQTSEHREEVNQAIKYMAEFLVGLESGYQGTRAFRDSIGRLPRLTSKLHKAKRTTTNELDQLLKIFQSAQEMVKKIISEIPPM